MTLRINNFLIIFLVYFSLHASYLHANESTGDQSPIEDSQQLEDGAHDSLDEVNGPRIQLRSATLVNIKQPMPFL
jgi:curli production assembly/transport component CsgE